MSTENVKPLPPAGPEMSIRTRIQRVLVEFAVVVIGVMVALAGDSWREARVDARLEHDYLQRLSTELVAGRTAQAAQRRRIQETVAANRRLVQRLEAPGPIEADPAIADLIAATRVGFEANQFGDDVTYRELVASGQLRLIEDALLRESVLKYYLGLDRVRVAALAVVPLPDEIARATGQLPFEFVEGSATLSADDRRRLLSLLRTPDILPNLREAEAQLRRLDLFLGFLDEAAASLLARLDSAG